jgi:hypothetical protein
LSSGFPYMIITILGSVGAYWLWAFKFNLNENAGLLVSTLTAMLLAYLFFKLRKR